MKMRELVGLRQQPSPRNLRSNRFFVFAVDVSELPGYEAQQLAKNPASKACTNAGAHGAAPALRDHATSDASSVMLVLNSFETGQFALAFAASDWNVASSAPGTFAFSVRCTAVMLKPSPTFSRVT